jgi:CDP-glycerol glycerophosphotransferase
MISGSKVRTKTFRSAFSYSGPILEIGTPRNDIFFDENDQIIRMVKNEIGIDSDDKIVLFAPTFRDRKSENPIPFDTNKLLDNLSIKMSGKWKFVIKMHPADINSNYNFCSDIVNATKYNDMQALLYSSDILISDYSSLIFDFMLKKAPCFLFLNDYDSYTSNERELYIDVRTLPFPIAFSEDQLLQMISEFDSESYAKSIDVFMNEIESFERGYARKKILDIILNMTRK